MPKEGGKVASPATGKANKSSNSRTPPLNQDLKQDLQQDFQPLFDDVSRQDMDRLVKEIIHEYDLPSSEVFELLSTKKSENGIKVPITVFQDKRMTLLESLVRFLRDSHDYSNPEVALMSTN